MERNEEMRLAWEFAEHTGKSIFLTGKAGTGKTTFLKTLVEKSTKRLIVVAPTGVAAINAGGMTIHSFFQLPLSPFVPNATVKQRFDFSKEKRKIISTIDMLVIDEISMVRSDLLDAVDSVLRRFRVHEKPFGGVQLLMIGDLGQLTPVVTPEDERMLQPYYDTPYFFGSYALRQVDYVTIQLEHVYRQQDTAFLDILNHIRSGHPTSDDLSRLNMRYVPGFKPADDAGYIRLTTHNLMANRYNESALEQLPTKAFHYQAVVEGTFPEYAYPTALTLTLKVGAQVMFIKNDLSEEHLYYNGRIGRVVELRDDAIRVLCSGDAKPIDVSPQVWENAKYKLNDKTKEIETEIQGTFQQFPLRLAWSITIHKSQGLTFDHAVIDASYSFAPGQVYVALSRCRTLEGMVLSSPLPPSSIINDQRVDSYIRGQQQATQVSVAKLPLLKEEYHRNLLMELFTFNDLAQKEEALCRVFIEFFHRSHPSLTTRHKQTLLDLRLKVMDVAAKWLQILATMPIEQLHADDSLERVCRSAGYFKDTLSGLFQSLLEQSKAAKSNNKLATKRLDATFSDLQLAYQTRMLLLERMEESLFTVAGYLKAKQETLLEAMDRHDTPKTRKRRERKEKDPKPKKERTQEVTVRMYKGGMLPSLIAKERGLSITTIYNHLGVAATNGLIALAELIDADKEYAIRTAIAKAGEGSTLSAVKLLCPPDVRWEELHLIVAMDKSNAARK